MFKIFRNRKVRQSAYQVAEAEAQAWVLVRLATYRTETSRELAAEGVASLRQMGHSWGTVRQVMQAIGTQEKDF
jgi:hypothetical protein